MISNMIILVEFMVLLLFIFSVLLKKLFSIDEYFFLDLFMILFFNVLVLSFDLFKILLLFEKLVGLYWFFMLIFLWGMFKFECEFMIFFLFSSGMYLFLFLVCLLIELIFFDNCCFESLMLLFWMGLVLKCSSFFFVMSFLICKSKSN